MSSNDRGAPAGETPSVRLRPSPEKHQPSAREVQAMRVARAWHGEQKYGEYPYSLHLCAVRDVLLEFRRDHTAYDDHLLCAAWLHDIIEDTDCPARLIAQEFGPDVLNLVWAVTGFGASRKERAEDAYRKIEKHLFAPILKCADRIANVRASIGTPLMQMYLKAWPEFKRRVAVRGTDAMWTELCRLHEQPPTP